MVFCNYLSPSDVCQELIPHDDSTRPEKLREVAGGGGPAGVRAAQGLFSNRQGSPSLGLQSYLHFEGGTGEGARRGQTFWGTTGAQTRCWMTSAGRTGSRTDPDQPCLGSLPRKKFLVSHRGGSKRWAFWKGFGMKPTAQTQSLMGDEVDLRIRFG